MADLGTNRMVVAIRTLGGQDDFITQFMLTISSNGSDWSDVADESGSTVIFEGNTVPSIMVSNPLPTPVETRFVKFTIIAPVNGVLRWAIDGCPV